MKSTPLTERFIESNRSFLEDGMDEAVQEFAGKLERLLGEAREMILRLKLSGDFHDLPESLLTDADTTLARIDATLDPNNLEGPPRTREEMAADARELNRIAPTPADKFALMMRNPDYVEAPMQVSVTTIDPDTGEVKQGVATTDEQLRGWMKVIRPAADDDHLEDEES